MPLTVTAERKGAAVIPIGNPKQQTQSFIQGRSNWLTTHQQNIGVVDLYWVKSGDSNHKNVQVQRVAEPKLHAHCSSETNVSRDDYDAIRQLCFFADELKMRVAGESGFTH